jgi:hypothetical protein
MKSQRKWKHGKSNVEKVRRKEEARALRALLFWKFSFFKVFIFVEFFLFF